MPRFPGLPRCWGMLLLVLLVAPAYAARINGNLVVTGHENYCLDVGTVNAYACPLLYPITQYVPGAQYAVKAATANTGAPTVALSGLAAKTIKKMVGSITTDLVANDIRVGQIFTVQYDGVNMQMTSQLGNAASPTADFASNTSTSVDSEVVLFSGTTGKTGKRATGTGAATLTAGVLGVATGTGLATLTAGVLGSVTAPTGAVTGTIASGSIALATAAIGSGVCATEQTVTATGVLTTDVVMASFNQDVSAVTGFTASVNGTLRVDVYPKANQVGLRVCNATAASISPGAVTLNFRVVR